MAGELPTFEELLAPSSWQVIDFISDLHLCEETPVTFDAWSQYMATTPADSVIILGDLFEAWVGDDSRHAGFEARCAEVLRSAAAVRSVSFMVGNRDFLVGQALLAACGVRALADPTVLVAGSDRILLSHGDSLCLDDIEYQQIRRMSRDPAWQSNFLALPLAERRLLARQWRAQSQQRKAEASQERWFDVDRPTAVGWMKAVNTPVFIHGHTHRPATEAMAPGLSRHVLSDWEFDHAAVARAEVLRWQATGLTRLPLPS